MLPIYQPLLQHFGATAACGYAKSHEDEAHFCKSIERGSPHPQCSGLQTEGHIDFSLVRFTFWYSLSN